MIKRAWPLILLLLLVGCAAEVSSSSQAQLRLSPQLDKYPIPTGNPAMKAPTPPLEATDLAATGATPIVDGADENPPVLAEEELDEPLDPETLADNAALQSADAIPPEEEGETIFLDAREFDFPVVDNEKVRYFVEYFKGPLNKHVRTWLERSTRYLPMMREIFAEQGLPRDLVYLAMIESGFNSKAFSRARASGQWQFIEGTGRAYGLSNDWWRDERRDPEKATRAAARHLSDLYRMFDGDWYLALAAYNAGAGKIKKAIERYGTRDFWELTHGSYLKEETKHYVPKMLAGLMIAKHPERYGFTDLAFQEPLVYELAVLPSVTDVDVIAKLADSDYETIKKLNPELKRWSTPPGVQDYTVRLPVGSGAAFVERYVQLPENQRANFVYHKIKKGDTPGTLAKRYGVRTDDILRFNKLRDSRSLKVGQNLLIPLNPEASKMSLAELRESLRDDNPAAKTAKGAGKNYKVRSGDSLYKIAQRFNVTEKQLREWNGLGSKSALKAGQTLVVSSAAPVKAAKASASAPGGLKTLIYQVQAGDTLWEIGRRFDVEEHQIRDWNKLPDNPVLQPGQHLTLQVKNTPRG